MHGAEALASRVRVRALDRQPLTAIVNASLSGDTQIVGPAAGYRIRVLAYHLVSAGTVNVKWRSGFAGTTIVDPGSPLRDLTGAMPLVANGQLALSINVPEGWLLQTDLGQALTLNLSAAVGVTGFVTYVVETE